MLRVPTIDDYRAFDGAHAPQKWNGHTDEWRCPACQRTKFELLRWTKRTPSTAPAPFESWLAVLVEHHDHGSDRFGYDEHGMSFPKGPERFAPSIICDQCNAADGLAKRRHKLPESWSFSPEEIGEFVTATPHARHVIDYPHALKIYERDLFGTRS
jgi:hypothetical protein